MNVPVRLVASAALALTSAGLHAQFIPPTPAELAMTSIPEVPGATAVYLYKEQNTDDALRMFSFYVRLKVLTEGGKEYANVELPYQAGSYSNIDSISGRTIHPDGTIIAFTGKPYEKLIGKSGGYSVKAKVFTLPDVEVGSIIEYRYKMHYDDQFFQSPDWFIQTDLFIRKGHFQWMPNTSGDIINSETGQRLGNVAWTPILPAGTTVKQSVLQTRSIGGVNVNPVKIELDVHDIPPLPHEEFMPATDSISYRVLFYYTAYGSPAEFWKVEGKRWSKARDRFIGSESALTGAASDMIAGATTEDAKLRKLYAAIMTFENTDFTRERSTAEDRAEGLRGTVTALDILKRKRGSGDQLTELFVGLARAAGIKANVMGVANRNERIFFTNYLSMRQLDDLIAAVTVDGKDIFLDPGQRFCTYGQLAWKHTLTAGLRQTDSGAELLATPATSFKEQRINRIGDLVLDDTGSATGTVKLSLTGDSALRWRQEAVRGDDTSLNLDLRNNMERSLPGGMDVRVEKVDNLTDSDKPLIIAYTVKGGIGSPTGKRLLVPANLFEANSKPRFPHPSRELDIDLNYSSTTQDAVRIRYPDSMLVESSPTPDKAQFQTAAAFSTSSSKAGNTITCYRNVTLGRAIYAAKDYTDFRAFYNKLEAKDAETVILTGNPNPTTAASN